LFAYAVFIYSALGLIGLQLVTPDLCVAAVVFAAAGHVLAMIRRGPTWGRAILLGLILGLGYLSKSVMFVLSLVLVLSLPLSPPLRSRGLRYVLMVAGAFAVAATLLIIPISRKAGNLTFGTSSNLGYAFMVNRVPYTNWQGDSSSSSGLLHPPRRLNSDPEIFDYSAHLVGTYPAWFDPTYWTAGVSPEFHLSSQVRALYQTGGFYVNFFIGGSGAVATILVVLIWLCADCLSMGPQLRRQLPLIVFGLAGLAIYFLVYVESRYVAAFAALLWILPTAAARGLEPREPVQWLNRAALICAACLVVPIALRAAADAWESRRDTSPHPQIAAHLHSIGIQPGDRVANIGIDRDERSGSSFDAFWAYLARVQIVAEIPNGQEFLCADEAIAKRVYSQLAQVGARAVVTMAMPSRWCSAGWQNVQGTKYYVRLLG
jgi:4-amino-4-deoxy-L-arabinose transferase-like glycosyltransferase